MSADRLREAAKVLRVRALDAAPHPWESIPAGAWTGRIFAADSEMVAKTSTDVSDDHSNAAYIATMHPGVGLALAKWLDAEALTLDHHVTAWEAGKRMYPFEWREMTVESNVRHHYGNALAIADLILGGQS